MFITFGLIALILILIPAWKIFQKAGLHPALSLLIFIPAIGGLIVLIILAYSDWQPVRR